MILHLDLDAFFAALEQRDHPEWRGLPLVVGAAPGGRGVVATCSYEARRYGVHSAMPIGEAVRRLPPETVYVRPQMARYAEASRQVMTALERLSPVIEPVSVDEAFLDVTGLERLIGPPEAIGRQAKMLVQETVGLTASVGIGPNRLIAKLASERDKPDGLTVVPSETVQAFLDPLPLTVLRGLGRRTAPKLRALGLETVADVRALSLEHLRRLLGAHQGTRIYQQARGLAEDRVEVGRSRQSISKETTFPEDVTDPALLRETLRWAAQEVAYLARHGGYQGTVVTLKIRFRGFETHTRTQTLRMPTADDRTLFRTAWALLEAGRWGARPVRLIGLGLSAWAQGLDAAVQPDLFSGANRSGADWSGANCSDVNRSGATCSDANRAPVTPTETRLNETLDAIRARFGPGVIQRGGQRRRP
nr:DNA polymerase IV [Halochromatium glycolicum]